MITEPATGQFFENYGANVNRLNDRVLIGAAADNDACAPNVVKDWLEAVVGNTVLASQAAVLSTIGGIGLVAGSRASDSTWSWTFGSQSFAINDDTETPHPAWAAYAEARRSAGAGLVQGMEIDVINQGDAGSIDPYLWWQNVTAIGQWLSCGRPDVESGDATVALGIINNTDGAGGRYVNGIVFGHDAIAGTDGVTGQGCAVALAKGHQVEWYAAGGQPPVAAVGCVNGGGTELYSQGQRCVEARDPTATTETGMLLAINRSGVVTVERVKIGASNSGGVGKRALVVNN
jgi:hypothetical protein